ncbi:iron-sulfur cluster assembly accessory protein [Candidatus Liberibacter sp.]|uniref:HesB/IscA family protein n=1 Tax=Candidatus Liberibacter sp. TaxID=34022 RepID=UPI0015F4DB77|nr:iron-sulfur cluster assembly accessory protein [Candidatus Liberibacter sp.]MBA5724382.1 iron-sulfur cluster assembly accessory protein [Candidatus Liberibacter sp.]
MKSLIKITDSAAKQIKFILASEKDKQALRITVEGGGCSGFSYKFDLATELCHDDIVFEKDGAKIFIDQISLAYMENSEVDFVDNLIRRSFQIHNPNVSSNCGCGTSFSI